MVIDGFAGIAWTGVLPEFAPGPLNCFRDRRTTPLRASQPCIQSLDDQSDELLRLGGSINLFVEQQ